MSCINKSFHRCPFRNEHAERREEHTTDTDHHAEAQVRHRIEKAVKPFNVAAAKLLFRRPDRKKQERFGDRMEDNNHNGCPCRLIRTYTRTADDQSQIGNCGIGKNLFPIGL